MKRNQIALLILIMGIGLMVSYFVVSSIFANLNQKDVKVETIEVIKSKIDEPDSLTFHDESINPAVQIFIGIDNKEQSSKEKQ